MQSNPKGPQALLEIPYNEVYHLYEQNKKQQAEGNLKLFLIEETQIYYLNVGSFYLTLNKNIVLIALPFETQITYVFPHNEIGFFALVVSMIDDNWASINNIIADQSTIISKETVYGHQELQAAIEQHFPSVLTVSLVEENISAFYLQQGGKNVKQSLTWIGATVAIGVGKGSDYLNSKLGDKKSFELNPTVKQGLKTVQDTSKKAFQKTSDFFGKLFQPVVEKTNEIGNGKIEKINQIYQLLLFIPILSNLQDISQQIQKSQNPAIKYMKEAGKGAAEFVNQTAIGVENGIQKVGGAVSNQPPKYEPLNNTSGSDAPKN